jgi:hypothetical protein
MNKSLLLPLFAAAAVAAMPAPAQSNAVYAVKYSLPANSFGTIDLSSGNFTNIASIGAASINDIAWCPTNGSLYAISNLSVLVKINVANGAITKVASLSKQVQSLAFRSSDGALFAASANKLYIINLVSNALFAVGDFGSPPNLKNGMQNGQTIRFAQDGNLYVSNTNANTDIYQVSTTNGMATWMGEATGCSGAMLQSAGQNMYGVAKISGNKAELVTFDFSSFLAGGINADGSTHRITFSPAGAGTNFPANLVFSGTSSASAGGSQTAVPAPLLSCGVNGANQFVVSWQGAASQSYQLQCTTNLLSGVWTSVGGSLTGTGVTLSVTNNMNGVPQCFFRLEL